MRYNEIILQETADAPGLPPVTDDLIYDVIDYCLRLGGDYPEDDESLEEMRFRLYGELDELSVGIVGDRLTVYRGISLANIRQLNKGRNLGVYWSSKPATAFPYNGDLDGRFFLRLTGQVRLADIIWHTTLALHLEGGEYEVRVREGAPITIVDARWISHQKGKLPKQPRQLISKTFAA